MDTYEAKKMMVGRTIVSVNGTDLVLSNGVTLRCEVDGECCSASYFTDTNQFQELEGKVVQDVEDRDGQSHDGLEDSPDA